MVSPALSSWWGIAGLMELKREIRVRTSTSLSSFLPVRDPHQRLLSRAAETQRKLFKAPWCQTESSGILSLLCYGTKDTQPKFSEVISKLTVLPCPPPPPPAPRGFLSDQMIIYTWRIMYAWRSDWFSRVVLWPPCCRSQGLGARGRLRAVVESMWG